MMSEHLIRAARLLLLTIEYNICSKRIASFTLNSRRGMVTEHFECNNKDTDREDELGKIFIIFILCLTVSETNSVPTDRSLTPVKSKTSQSEIANSLEHSKYTI